MKIIAGRARGLKLKEPRDQRIRPTSGRMREALFSVLLARLSLEGKRVLDAFSGTGALAIEAVSRGAAGACCIEKVRRHVELLQENVSRARMGDEIHVVNAACPAAVRHSLVAALAPYDVIFLDPPYRKNLIQPTIEAILAAGIAAADALFIVELAQDSPAPVVQGLACTFERSYGGSQLLIFEGTA